MYAERRLGAFLQRIVERHKKLIFVNDQIDECEKLNYRENADDDEELKNIIERKCVQ